MSVSIRCASAVLRGSTCLFSVPRRRDNLLVCAVWLRGEPDDAVGRERCLVVVAANPRCRSSPASLVRSVRDRCAFSAADITALLRRLADFFLVLRPLDI